MKKERKNSVQKLYNTADQNNSVITKALFWTFGKGKKRMQFVYVDQFQPVMNREFNEYFMTKHWLIYNLIFTKLFWLLFFLFLIFYILYFGFSLIIYSIWNMKPRMIILGKFFEELNACNKGFLMHKLWILKSQELRTIAVLNGM